VDGTPARERMLASAACTLDRSKRVHMYDRRSSTSRVRAVVELNCKRSRPRNGKSNMRWLHINRQTPYKLTSQVKRAGQTIEVPVITDQFSCVFLQNAPNKQDKYSIELAGRSIHVYQPKITENRELEPGRFLQLRSFPNSS
jgi:hypothetical protein